MWPAVRLTGGWDRARRPKGSAPWALFTPRGPSKVRGKRKTREGANGMRGRAQRLKGSAPWALFKPRGPSKLGGRQEEDTHGG